MSRKQPKKLLVLGARQMQLPAIATAREMGLTTIAIDPVPNAVGLTLADYSYCCDLGDEISILYLAKQHDIDGILTLAADYPVPMVAKVCQKLGLPGLSNRAAMVSTDKARMRKALQAKNVAIPQWRDVRSLTQAITSVREFDGAVIIKPADSSGGRGVTLISHDASEIVISQAFYKALNFSQQGRVMIEQFISGKEISVEAITVDGKTTIVQMTDKVTTEAPFFVEIGHSQPTQLSAWEKERVAQLTIAGIAALRIDRAASHTEIRFKGDRPYLIEIGARLGGGYIASHLVPLSCGVDLVKATIQLAIGEPPDLQPTKNYGSAIRFLRPHSGRVAEVRGVAAAKKVPGVTEIAIEVGKGKLINPLQNATDRVGHVISYGKNAIAAIQNAETAQNLIAIDIQASKSSGRSTSDIEHLTLTSEPANVSSAKERVS